MYRQATALSAGLCLYLTVAWPQAFSSALTPDQLVETAIARNRDFISLKQRVIEAQGLRKQAGVGPPDTVELTGLAGQPLGNSSEDNFTAAYSHTFETFGKRNKRVAVAQTEIRLAQAQLAERRRALSFEIKSRYADAIAEQQKLAILQRLLSANREYLRLTEARLAKGDVAPLEADLLRVEFNRDEARLAATVGRSRSAVLLLKTSVGLPGEASLSLASSLAPPSFDAGLQRLQALALENRPDLIALKIMEERSAAQTVLATAEAKPNPTLSGLYSHSDNAFDQFGLMASGALVPLRAHDDSIGVGLSIPLTSTKRSRGNIEAAAARQAGARLRREYLEGIIPTQVEAAYQQWQAARDAAAVFTDSVVDRSEKNLAVMRQAYNLGELRLIDVLNEQRRLLDTELSYIDAQTDLFRAYLELEQAVGGSPQ